ncbi:MAG: hypothetical protein ACR2PA_26115, partial [Hyphomicrobiaceae bacterium]
MEVEFDTISPMSIDELERAVLDAHAQSDGRQLAKLYTAAADHYEHVGDVDAACFFLTQALVFALQEGADLAHTLQRRLHAYGREHL